MQAITRLMRRMVYNFIKINHDLMINGIKLDQIITTETATVDEYIENIVLMHKEDARTVVTMAMPLVLRINIGVVMFMTKDEVKSTSCEEVFKSKVQDFDYAPGDSLNFHEKKITVMLRPGHYDILYLNDYYLKDLQSYEMKFSQNPKIEEPIKYYYILHLTRNIENKKSFMIIGEYKKKSAEFHYMKCGCVIEIQFLFDIFIGIKKFDKSKCPKCKKQLSPDDAHITSFYKVFKEEYLPFGNFLQ